MNRTESIAEFFDKECCAGVDPGASALLGSDRVDDALLAALTAAGFTGSALEMGSGDGEFSRRLLEHGALSVTGLDLSPRSVEHATNAARAAGLDDRLSYRVGDAAQASLGQYDAVVSEKVFCCYFDPRRLLANTLPAARTWYVLALPESRGLAGLLARVVIRLENAWRWLRRDPFRAYVHDVRSIEARIRGAGFELLSARREQVWLVLAFRRLGQSPS